MPKTDETATRNGCQGGTSGRSRRRRDCDRTRTRESSLPTSRGEVMLANILHGAIRLPLWGYAAFTFAMVQLMFLGVSLYLHRDQSPWRPRVAPGAAALLPILVVVLLRHGHSRMGGGPPPTPRVRGSDRRPSQPGGLAGVVTVPSVHERSSNAAAPHPRSTLDLRAFRACPLAPLKLGAWISCWVRTKLARELTRLTASLLGSSIAKLADRGVTPVCSRTTNRVVSD
jgi:hypothetical protein